MSSDSHDLDRASQQDARAWSTFTATKYTAAKRQISSPLAQGFLGDRFSARDLIAVLDDHPLVGADEDGPVLGENGYYADRPWSFNGQTDYIELALVIDMLRMFTTTTEADAAVSSYRLKHTAEALLAPHCSYVSNGRLIWAAAALGLPLVETDSGGPNLLVGISEAEHDYVRQLTDGSTPPRAHHHRPAGLPHLQNALDRIATGKPAAPRWVPLAAVPIATPFHNWLSAQARRDDRVGDIARDYVDGIAYNQHGPADAPADLLTILLDAGASDAAYDAGVRAISEWFSANSTAKPVRTKFVSRSVDEVGGFGGAEGYGDIEKVTYLCPCGAGEVVEDHDNIPGARDHDVRIRCDKCRGEWAFAPGRSVRDWGLVPV